MAATDFTFVQLGRGRIDPAGNTFFGDTKNRTIRVRSRITAVSCLRSSVADNQKPVLTMRKSAREP